MLAKKKATKKVAMKAAVEASRLPTAVASTSDPSGRSSGGTMKHLRESRREKSGAARPVLTRRDALEAGSGDGRSDLIKQIGDNVNTRLQEISFDDDIDADLFDERQRELLEEARLTAGTQQRVVSDRIAQFLQTSSTAAATTEAMTATEGTTGRDDGLQLLRIRHNSNAVTAVAHLGSPPEVVVFGDKTGKVYLADLAPRTSATGLVHSVQTDAPRHQKVLLEPAMRAAIVSIAISDTRDARPTTRDLFEKTTVDMSCTSYLVAGAADGAISVWETATRKHKGFLTMHKKPITGLSFRALTSTLYSVCQDGTLRVWSVPQMMAVDKLFGHEGPVYGVDGLRRESCASVGEDGTMRFWNVPAATQQAFAYVNNFHPHAAERRAATSTAPGAAGKSSASAAENKPYQIALECVAMLSEQLVVVGAVDGSLLVFDVNRRKPLCVIPAAHGYDFHGDGTGLESAALLVEGAAGRGDGSRRGVVPNPITAVAAVPYADVIASASYDGVVRLWRVSAADSFIARGKQANTKEPKPSGTSLSSSSSIMHLLAEVPVHALVTSLRLSATGDALIVGCSKEPRLGRWVVQRAALNSVCVLPLTDAGLKAYTHLVGLSIEHVPALLYGFNEGEANEEEDGSHRGDDDEDGEDANTRAMMSRLTHARKTKGGAGGAMNSEDDDEDGDLLDALAVGEEGDEEAQDDDDSATSMSPLFVVGADGQLQFRPSTLPAMKGEANSVADSKTKKTKKTKKAKKAVSTNADAAGGASAKKAKKAKKAPGVLVKKQTSGVKGKDKGDAMNKKKVKKLSKK